MTSSNFYTSNKKNIFSLKNNENIINNNVNNQIYSETDASINVDKIAKKIPSEKDIFIDKHKNENSQNNTIGNYNFQSNKENDEKNKISNKNNFNINFTKNINDINFNYKNSKKNISNKNGLNNIQKYTNADLFNDFNNTRKHLDSNGFFTEVSNNNEIINPLSPKNLKINNEIQENDNFNKEIQTTNPNFKFNEQLNIKNNNIKVFDNNNSNFYCFNTNKNNYLDKNEKFYKDYNNIQIDDSEIKNKNYFNINKNFKLNNNIVQSKNEENNREDSNNIIPKINIFKKESFKNKESINSETKRNENNSEIINNINNIGIKMPFLNSHRNTLNKEKIIFKNSPINKIKKQNGRTVSQDFNISVNLNSNVEFSNNEKISPYKKLQFKNNLILSLEEDKLQKEKMKKKIFSFSNINSFNNQVLSEYYDKKLNKNNNDVINRVKNKANKKINRNNLSKNSNSKNMQSMDLNNEISFARESSKIIIDEVYNKEKFDNKLVNKNCNRFIDYNSNINYLNDKKWKIIEFDLDKHNQIMENLLKKTISKEFKHRESKMNINGKNLRNFYKNKLTESETNLYTSTNEKINEILHSTGNLNHNIPKNKFTETSDNNEKNDFQAVFNKDKNIKYSGNFFQNKTITNFGFKNGKENNQNKNFYYMNDEEENLKEKIKPEEIESIMKRVLNNTKKEVASKTRDFLKNVPQNYMNLGKSQQRFYININKKERPTTTFDNNNDHNNNYDNNKHELINFYEFNLTEKNLWKKHEDFWFNLITLGKEFIETKKNFNIDIENYIFPPNDEDILLSYFCRINNINDKFYIDENIEKPVEEINKWKNAYKKVVMRWHPDKLNPILDSINIKDDLKIMLNKKAAVIISNMNKNLKFIVGLIKRIIVKKDINKNIR